VQVGTRSGIKLHGITGLAAVAGADGVAAGAAGSDRCSGPFLLGDILSYALWPYDYYYPFWSYGTFPGYYYEGYAPAYDYSYGYGHGSGGLSDIYGYNRGGYSRHASRTSHKEALTDQIPTEVRAGCGNLHRTISGVSA
jgi:hypothetical protein